MTTVRIELLGQFAVTVDGVRVAEDSWRRRHAAAIVKVLAMASEHRLHREQLIDLVWPDDLVEEALPKLHKAAHFARRALGVEGALVLRGEQVLLLPDHELDVDVAEFDELAKRAVSTSDPLLARAALDLYRGELLPADRYDPWADERREQLRAKYVDLLRLDQRWDVLVELDPSDEDAHLALMRQHAAAGDRHAALRQFERLDRSLRRELGVSPGREAQALRERLIATDGTPRPSDDTLVGRTRELAVLEQALQDSTAAASRTIIVVGAAGMGKSAIVRAVAGRARELGFRIGSGSAAPVEGAWSYAPVVEALADLCRRHPALLDGLADHHRDEILRALRSTEVEWSGESTHQGLFVAAAELVRLASSTSNLLLVIDDIHDADDASLRLVHYIARSSRAQRVCIVLTQRDTPSSDSLVETRHSLIERHGAVQIDLRPLDRGDVATLVRRQVPDAGNDVIEQVVRLSRGVPFAVNEIARRAATEPAWVRTLEANTIGGLDPATREVLQRVAVVGSTFDTDEFVVLSGLSEDDAFDHLDVALAAAVVEPSSSGYRFRHALVRDALLEDVPPHRRRRIHRDAATSLIELGAPPGRIGHHLLQAGAAFDAVPHLLHAAESEAAIGAYRDALALVDSVRPHATGNLRARALELRGELLNALGDPIATYAYREALEGADPASARRLRARLARSAVMSGDLDTARAALDGLETDGGPDDADILLARGNLAFFDSDLDAAARAVDEAQQLVLAGQNNWKVLDLVSLQGLLAHLSGNWFDRMRLELRRTRENPSVANAIFDGHLCAAEYVLYGPTPYAEVIEIARDLQITARRSGALRAVAFASALIGEASLLSGDLETAEVELTEASELHRDLGSVAGESHTLQRLAELHLARGDREEARALLQRALPLARRSMVPNHLLQRIFGTMILAASDPDEGRAVVDRAESTLGWDDQCPFCSVMLSVPATIACARAGDLDASRRHLELAQRSTLLWQGTSWEAAVAEAQAELAAAEGDAEFAAGQWRAAADQFERAGQPLDADRCRQALAAV
ncbi:MAG: AAA family ATPase [Ilumatobacteraceae bacterium]